MFPQSRSSGSGALIFQLSGFEGSGFRVDHSVTLNPRLVKPSALWVQGFVSRVAVVRPS